MVNRSEEIVHLWCHSTHYRTSIAQIEASKFLETTAEEQEGKQYSTNKSYRGAADGHDGLMAKVLTVWCDSDTALVTLLKQEDDLLLPVPVKLLAILLASMRICVLVVVSWAHIAYKATGRPLSYRWCSNLRFDTL